MSSGAGASSGDDAVSDFLRGEVDANRIPGASWWAEEDSGAVSRGAVGWACIEPRREDTSEGTAYDLASLTKPLATALLAVILEEGGEIDLEGAAVTLLPELRDSPYAAASLLDLGAHRAGLPAWKPLYLSASDLDGYVRLIARTSPAASRGETLYSDLGYMLLGAAIERTTGERLDSLFERRVARPLALSGIGFSGPGRFRHAAATERGNVYESRLAGEPGAAFPWRASIPRGEVHDVNAHVLGGVAGHAGLFGTAAAVAAVAREMFGGGALRCSALSRQRLFCAPKEKGARSFGFVLARDSGAARGVLPDEAPGHTGFTGTSLWLDPARARLFVLLTNRVHPQVPIGDFAETRRGFHLAAARVLGA